MEEIERLKKIMFDFLKYRILLERETDNYAEGQLLSDRGMFLRDKMREAIRDMAKACDFDMNKEVSTRYDYDEIMR
jgi:hypothetical protein